MPTTFLPDPTPTQAMPVEDATPQLVDTRTKAQQMLAADPIDMSRLAAVSAAYSAALARLQSLTMLADACTDSKSAAFLSIDGVAANPVRIDCAAASSILASLMDEATAELQRLADGINAAIKVLP